LLYSLSDSDKRKNGKYYVMQALTACGNGLGCGDFLGDSVGCDDVGVWAFATLEYTEQVPEGYTQAHYIFKE